MLQFIFTLPGTLYDFSSMTNLRSITSRVFFINGTTNSKDIIFVISIQVSLFQNLKKIVLVHVLIFFLNHSKPDKKQTK